MSRAQSHWSLTILTSITAILNMAIPMVLVRLLTKEDIYLYKVFFLYLTVGPWNAFSASIFNGLYYWRGKQDESSEIAQQAWSLLLSWTLLLFVLAIGLSQYINSWINGNYTITLIFIIAAVLGIMAKFYENVTVAAGMVRKGAIFSSVIQLCRMIGVVFIVYMYRDVVLIFIVFTLVTAAEVLLGTYLGWRQNQMRFVWRKKRIKQIFSYSLPLLVAFGVTSVAASADKIILSTYLAKADFAIYIMGCLAIPPLTILETSISQVIIPKMAVAFEQKRGNQVNQLYQGAVYEIAFFFIPVVVGLIFFAQPIVLILFSEQYLASAPFLQIFSLIYLFHIIPHDIVQRGQGNSVWIMKSIMIFAASALCLAFIGAKLFGAKGALLGVVGNELGRRIYACWYFKSHLGWRIKDITPYRKLFFLLKWSLIPAVIAWLCHPLVPNERAWGLLFGGFCWVVYLLKALPDRFGDVRKDMDTKHVLQLKRSSSAVASSLEHWRSIEWATPVTGPRGIWQLFRFIQRNQISVIHSSDGYGFWIGGLMRILWLGKIRHLHTLPDGYSSPSWFFQLGVWFWRKLSVDQFARLPAAEWENQYDKLKAT